MLVKAAYVREDIIMSHRIINPYHTWRNKWDWLKGMPPWWSMVTLLSGWHILFQVTTTHLKIGYPCARTSMCLPMSSFVYRLHHTRVHIKVLCLSFWSWWYQTIISSAASKVTEAYPMPSRQSSVCPSIYLASAFLQVEIGSLSFIRSFRYLAWMCATILPKRLWN